MTTFNDIKKLVDALSSKAQSIQFTSTVDWDDADAVSNFVTNYYYYFAAQEENSDTSIPCVPPSSSAQPYFDDVKDWLQSSSPLFQFIDQYFNPVYDIMQDNYSMLTLDSQNWFKDTFNARIIDILEYGYQFELGDYCQALKGQGDLSKPCSSDLTDDDWLGVHNFFPWDDSNKIRALMIEMADKLVPTVADFAALDKICQIMQDNLNTVSITTLTDADTISNFLDDYENNLMKGGNCQSTYSTLFTNGMKDLESIGTYFNAYVMPFIIAIEGHMDLVSQDSQAWYKTNWQDATIECPGSDNMSLRDYVNTLKDYAPENLEKNGCPNFEMIYYRDAIGALVSLQPWNGTNQYVDSFYSAVYQIKPASSS